MSSKNTSYRDTWTGATEYWALSLFCQAVRLSLRRLPLYYFGAYNALSLYLEHPSYSPFVDWVHQPMKSLAKMVPDWDSRNVPSAES